MPRQPAQPLAGGRGYDAIAAPVFGRVHADRLLLEYDDERSGTFDPLRLVPDDKVVVLGLVTTKTSRIEPLEQIKARLDEASSLIDPGRLALSPQCESPMRLASLASPPVPTGSAAAGAGA